MLIKLVRLADHFDTKRLIAEANQVDRILTAIAFPGPTELKYRFCDDWAIFATDRDNDWYSVTTELWPEWGQIPGKTFEEAIAEDNAVEKYMLPIAKQRWEHLDWNQLSTMEQRDIDQLALGYAEQSEKNNISAMQLRVERDYWLERIVVQYGVNNKQAEEILKKAILLLERGDQKKGVNRQRIRTADSPTEQLVAKLNEDLAGEFNAIIMYIAYAAQVTGQTRPELNKFLLNEVEDEVKHATFLANKIVTLGGKPVTIPRLVSEAYDNTTILDSILQAESKAITDYTERAKQAEAYGDKALQVDLENIITDEQKHYEEVEKMLASNDRN